MSASKVRLGPTTTEVVLGSVLSILLGVLLASIYLAARPMKMVKAIPEEAEPGVIYFVEGRKDYEASRRWMFKRDVFVQGQSVQVTEGELNFWASSVYPTPSDGEKGGAMFTIGTPQFRIEDDELKAGAICKFDYFGVVYEIAVQAAGGFSKVGERFVFNPREVAIGGLPAHRMGPLGSILFKQFAGAFVPPEDVAQAWSQLADVHVEGNMLILGTP